MSSEGYERQTYHAHVKISNDYLLDDLVAGWENFRLNYFCSMSSGS